MGVALPENDRKYRVLRQIGEGGMAEVFDAEMFSQPGYSKHVAIKRVLPHLGRNKMFLRMFLDEARLGLLLNHSNIVLVFDVGRAGKDYFIVMEYVDGLDLREIFDAYASRGNLVPPEASLRIMVDICKGLDYAHRLAAANGQPLNVVHHDINPANVLLSKNGEVKLVDFGLSEAAVHVQKSDPDVVRGKFGYLAPEVATGKGADARSDLYAVGIMLFELTTGHRLFLGRDDMESLHMAQEARIPRPSVYNPRMPAALEQLILRALARDPEERYQNARRLGRAMTNVLFEMGQPVSSFDIGEMVEVIRSVKYEDENTSQRKRRIEKMIEEELVRFESLEYDVDEDFPGINPLWKP